MTDRTIWEDQQVVTKYNDGSLGHNTEPTFVVIEKEVKEEMNYKRKHTSNTTDKLLNLIYNEEYSKAEKLALMTEFSQIDKRFWNRFLNKINYQDPEFAKDIGNKLLSATQKSTHSTPTIKTEKPIIKTTRFTIIDKIFSTIILFLIAYCSLYELYIDILHIYVLIIVLIIIWILLKIKKL